MSHFDKAVIYVLQNEGGFVDNKNDHGGPTNYGITLEEMSEFLRRPATIDDVEFMHPNSATKIYLEKYWKPNLFEDIEQQAMATGLFDMFVNMGRHAIQLAQNIIRMDPQSVADGIIGPKTIMYLNGMDERYFIEAFKNAIDARYKKICENDITQVVFLGGWLNRSKKLLTLI